MADGIGSLPAAIALAIVILLPGVAWSLCLPSWFSGRIMIGPLLGIGSAGWAFQLAYLFGLPVGRAAVAAIVIPIIVIAIRWEALIAARWDIGRTSALYMCCFLASLFAVSWTVWPASGPWSGDWYAYLLQHDTLWSGAPSSGWTLARPLPFAALAVPFRLVFEALPALQLAACSFSAAALVAMLWIVGEFSRVEKPSASCLWLVGLSAFYLVNLTSIVPKFGQGVLIVSAFVVLRRASAGQLASRIVISSLLFALAVEIHWSTAAFAIAYAMALWRVTGRVPSRVLWSVLLCLPAALAIDALPEILRSVRFGLAQIVQYNPTVAMRGTQPVWEVWLLNIESTFLGWAYLLPLWNIIKLARDTSLHTIAYYANWIVLVHLATMANTFVLIFLPFAFTWQRLRNLIAFVRSYLPLDVAFGLASVPLICVVLLPYPVPSGVVHAGATALAVGGLALCLAWLANAPHLRRASLLVTFGASTVWWFGWNAIQYIAVLRAGGYLYSGPQWEMDRDWSFLIQSGQIPWGYDHAVSLSVVLACLTAISAWLVVGLTRHASRRALPERKHSPTVAT